jgi:hypothetical protein
MAQEALAATAALERHLHFPAQALLILVVAVVLLQQVQPELAVLVAAVMVGLLLLEARHLQILVVEAAAVLD